MTESELKEAFRIDRAISDILNGQPEEMHAFLVAMLAARWVAGHVAHDPEQQAKVWGDCIAQHLTLVSLQVQDLAELHAEHLKATAEAKETRQ